MTVSAAVSNRADSADVDDKMKESGDNDGGVNEPVEELNFNSNNGNDLADDDSPAPTICVYGSHGMAGPLDLDITPNVELPDDSQCDCNVSSFTVIFILQCVREKKMPRFLLYNFYKCRQFHYFWHEPP